jgi:hypothetical protein
MLYLVVKGFEDFGGFVDDVYGVFDAGVLFWDTVEFCVRFFLFCLREK